MTGRRILIAAMLLFQLVRGLWLLFVIPPWQGPDEPMHLVLALAPATGPMSEEDRVSLEGAVVRSMSKNGFWELTGQVEPDPLPALIRRYRGTPSSTSYHRLLSLWLRATGAWHGWDPSEENTEEYVEKLLLAARTLSVLLGMGTLLSVFLFSSRILQDGWFQILPALLFLSFPQVAFGAVCVNSDSILMFLSALGLYILTFSLKARASRTSGAAVLFICFLAPIVKRTGLAVTLPLLPAVFWAWSGEKRRRSAVFLLVLLGLFTVALGAGLWATGLGRGMVRDIGEVLGIGGEVEELPHGWWTTFIAHLWATLVGNFGWVQCPLPGLWYKLIALFVAGLLVLIPAGIRKIQWSDSRHGLILIVLAGQLGVALIQVMVLLGTRGVLGQGRHIFVALPALSVLLAIGFRGLAPSHPKAWFWPMVGLVTLFLCEAALWFVMLPCFLH